MDRPLERRTAARTAVVWEAVRTVLEGRPADGPGARVLDIGGGTGGFAVRLAGLGHQVTVVDPSPDALAALARRADEDGVADRDTGLQGDLADLASLVPPGAGAGAGADPGADPGADLVLCHGVLGLVEDPAAALVAIGAVLRPGGTLSLLVSQHHAAVLARAMAGHLAQARALLEATTDLDARSGDRRFTADRLTGLLEGAGFEVAAVHGVRVFSDLVPSTLLDLEPGAAAALLDLERAAALRPEYLTLAAQLHVLATR